MKTPEQLRKEFWENDIDSTGGVIFNQYNEIKDIISNKDVTWINKQYLAIKQFAIEHTEYYRNLNIDSEFPVVSKMSILANYEAHKANGGFELPIHISSTSGSTGTPFAVLQDYQKRMRNIADLQVFGEFCDYPVRERMVFLRVLSEKLHRTKEQEDRENIYYMDSSDLSSAGLERMKQYVLEKKPRILFSYASTLVELAKHIIKSDQNEVFSMKSILTGGEGISDENRQLLEKAFGCTVYRRYSDMELGILGQDNGNGSSYELNWGSYYFECLKEDSDEPTNSGEVGRIVITDLFNKAMPMIRYDTGDLGVMEYFNDGRLPILKEIYGRKRDCIYSTRGDLISPAKISVSMWGAEGVHQWQFIQEDKFDYTLKLNCSENTDVVKMVDKLKDIVGADSRITVLFVDEIPVISSNKRRAVICNYQK